MVRRKARASLDQSRRYRPYRREAGGSTSKTTKDFKMTTKQKQRINPSNLQNGLNPSAIIIDELRTEIYPQKLIEQMRENKELTEQANELPIKLALATSLGFVLGTCFTLVLQFYLI